MVVSATVGEGFAKYTKNAVLFMNGLSCFIYNDVRVILLFHLFSALQI